MALYRRVGASHLLSLRRASFATSVLAVIGLLAVACSSDTWPARLLPGAKRAPGRFLQDLYPPDLLLEQPYGEDENRWLVFFHVIGISYMLLGLNTVCDVYFTGALEVMVEKWKIKPDVAGATFMAAGGSAPELFTSLIGATIANNDVGFGTIIGSAVFNVLFVIGLCGYVAKEPIQLTWWPLFRDCSYYVLGLSLLAGFASDELISLVEAIVLFVAYIVYCVIMYFNTYLESVLVNSAESSERKADEEATTSSSRPPVVIGNWAANGPAPAAVVPGAPSPPQKEDPQPPPPNVGDSASVLGSNEPARTSKMSKLSSSEELSHSRGNLFASQPLPFREREREGMGSHSLGSGSAHIERVRREPEWRKEDEMPELTSSQPLPSRSQKMRLSARTARAAALQEASRERQEERKNSVGRQADEAPREGHSSRPSAGMEQVQEVEESKPEGEADEEEEEELGLMDFPASTKDRVIWFLSLPVIAPIYFFTPQPSERLFLVSFVFSLVWIAGLSFLLVWWVEILGQALHIDPILMSFTLLAAGTSIPDGASSVAVAKQGEGDMAVSSSVGSNIFDILVGLPVPWMIKIALNDVNYQVTIKSPYLAFHVILLLFMVVAVVLSIHCLGWKLNRPLGLCMAVLYLGFLGIAMSVETAQPEWLKF